MSKAILCDRCGEVVCGETSPMRMIVGTNVNTNPMMAFGIDTTSDRYDLCEECAQSFDKWFVAGQVVS